jgi:type IV pilus modification protein PilV
MVTSLARRLRVLRRTPRVRHRTRSQRTGFTLLETMIALALLAIGILGVAALQITALRFARDSRTQTAAMYLAEQQMERFYSMTPATVRGMAGTSNDAGNPLHPGLGDDDQTNYNRSWTIQNDSPETGLIAISVQVNWVDPRGVARSTTLRALKADI